jgi:hypothetical protein
MSRKLRMGAIAITMLVAQVAQPVHAEQPKQVPQLPRDLEIELALNAAPQHLRDDAAVLVLESAGFVKAREGKNAFTCLVSRMGGDVFPVCWDAEGTRSVLPVYLDDAKLRLSGLSNTEVERRIAEGFQEGRYRAPARPGISYMLSPARYKIDEQGRISRSAPLPHVMLYGPYLNDADIGGARGSFAFINRVGPHGMIIVPVGQKERETILKESQSLVEQLERQIGFPQSSARNQ